MADHVPPRMAHKTTSGSPLHILTKVPRNELFSCLCCGEEGHEGWPEAVDEEVGHFLMHFVAPDQGDEGEGRRPPFEGVLPLDR